MPIRVTLRWLVLLLLWEFLSLDDIKLWQWSVTAGHVSAVSVSTGGGPFCSLESANLYPEISSAQLVEYYAPRPMNAALISWSVCTHLFLNSNWVFEFSFPLVEGMGFNAKWEITGETANGPPRTEDLLFAGQIGLQIFFWLHQKFMNLESDSRSEEGENGIGSLTIRIESTTF